MKKTLLIFITLLFLIIGYASVNTLLNITGILKIGMGNFDVRINNTIIDGADISDSIIAEDGKSFVVNLNKSSVVDFDIINNSLEYDAKVYLNCSSKGGPRSYIHSFITDNYIKANGSSHAQVYLNFNNQDYSSMINEMTARINELTVQYENGTNSEDDLISIQQEIDYLISESKRISSLMNTEDELTCSIGLNSIEKTTLDDKNYMDDIKMISASVDGTNYTPYIYNNGKSIKFTSNEDVEVNIDIRNDSITPTYYYLKCTNERATSTDSIVTSTPFPGYINEDSISTGKIFLYLNQESSKAYIEGIKQEIVGAENEIVDMNNRIKELENMKESYSETVDIDAINLEIEQLEEEKVRVNDIIKELKVELENAQNRYASDDTVTCNLNVERFNMIPKNEKDNIDIEISNVLLNEENVTSQAVSDKVNLNLSLEDNAIVNFNVKNNSDYDVIANIECTSEKETYPYYFLNNIIIKSKSFTNGGLRSYFYDNYYTYRKINSLNIQEAYILRTMEREEYQHYPEEEKKRFQEQLKEIQIEREDQYKNIITSDNVSCNVSVINFEE